MRPAVPFEFTVEVNPESVSLDLAEALVKAGVNRVSIGAQAFDDGSLQRLGRRHDAAAIHRCLKVLRRAGIDNLSVDLIYGWPGHSITVWKSCIETVLSCDVEHVSLYGFHLPDHDGWSRHLDALRDQAGGSVAGGSVAGGSVSEDSSIGGGTSPSMMIDEDLQADCYEFARCRLEAAGYQQYELSNFARPGRRSVHNCRYWSREDVLGIGAGAWSCVGGWRWKNVDGLDAYLERMNRGATSVSYAERLGREARTRERLVLGLRLVEGLDARAELGDFDESTRDEIDRIIEGFREEGLLQMDLNRVALTPRGMLLANEVMAALV